MTTPLRLDADTAADLMTPDPPALREDAPVRQAVALLTDRGVGAAAVLGQAGNLVGVLSRADLLAHERYQASAPTSEDPTLARDVMTPAVFSVAPNTPAAKVLQEMVALKVRQLFVVDQGGAVRGIISAFGILSRLRDPAAPRER
jgi:CBS domain-containing protein